MTVFIAIFNPLNPAETSGKDAGTTAGIMHDMLSQLKSPGIFFTTLLFRQTAA